MNKKKHTVSRRNFIASSSALALGTTLLGPNLFANNSLTSIKPNSKIKGVQIGVITYSFRSMPRPKCGSYTEIYIGLWHQCN
ncbi:hypothetical protein NYZ99_02135 [Maribacter litopenaei]|uniref:Tat (Twin-arginine translocation) pathway signal sequence n=1 Tax=Maribacter litopenaei TaxID=2976127 RepID=A0ABY5Y930_9FLAO|nr:hypothetical protein [Maribacter litopenaei]UWX55383.1 hypothetical protein NYZ99_02135 [Maribacter litopenaei]